MNHEAEYTQRLDDLVNRLIGRLADAIPNYDCGCEPAYCTCKTGAISLKIQLDAIEDYVVEEIAKSREEYLKAQRILDLERELYRLKGE